MRDAIASAPEFVVDVQDGAARIAEDGVDTFIGECLDEYFGASGPIHEAGLYASLPLFVKFILLRES
jgi:hypothetical protein